MINSISLAKENFKKERNRQERRYQSYNRSYRRKSKQTYQSQRITLKLCIVTNYKDSIDFENLTVKAD